MESETLKRVEELRQRASDRLAYVERFFTTAGPQEATMQSIAASLLGLLELSIWQVAKQYGGIPGGSEDE